MTGTKALAGDGGPNREVGTQEAPQSEDQRSSTGDQGTTRRDVLKGAAAAAALVAASGLSFPETAAAGVNAKKRGSGQPNMLIITCDEMRFPKVFPAGINSASEFLKEFMPKLYRGVWEKGVKFAGHHSAGNDCSPSRGVIFTGLYSQQSWLLMTIIDNATDKVARSPVLNKAYPTYGKLLREAGYKTPYIGKWHCSVPHQIVEGKMEGLEAYGFELINPKGAADPIGYNLQGTYGGAGAPDQADASLYQNDGDIADLATEWLGSAEPSTDQPWCLTVNFVNPHDKEFFPCGTEYKTFTELFDAQDELYQFSDWSTIPSANGVDWDSNVLRFPPDDYGYPDVPPNWESAENLRANKPSYQSSMRAFQSAVWGGVSEDPKQEGFTLIPYPYKDEDSTPDQPLGIGLAPYSYWKKSMDSYTQLMEILDVQIGKVLDALPDAVAENTIIMFTSDHGDYASAHGMVSGKSGTFYDECVRVPLVVVDPTGRYAREPETVRTGLTSHVDLLPLIVTLGAEGSRKWMRGDYAELYANRHDMLSMLRSPRAPGRKFVLYANDEVISPANNYLDAAWHLTGVVTERYKFAVYSNWFDTAELDPVGQEFEYYDYSTEGGRLEIDNTSTSRAAAKARRELTNRLIPKELRKPLPESLQPAQAVSRYLNEEFLKLLEDTSGAPH